MHDNPNVTAMRRIVEAEYETAGNSEVVKAVSVALQGFILAVQNNVTQGEFRCMASSLTGKFSNVDKALREVEELCARAFYTKPDEVEGEVPVIQQ